MTNMILRNVIRGIFHLAPVVPLFWSNLALSATLGLFLAVCYIKAKKLEPGFDKHFDLEQMPAENRKFIDSMIRAKKIWAYPTFLP